MKIIQHINGVVVDILSTRHDAIANNIVLVESIPPYEPKEGYNGVLMYSDAGLHWKYEMEPVTDEITDTEALDIILGGESV